MKEHDFRHIYWKYSLIALILLFGLILFYQALPYLNGVLIALTIFILIRGLAIRLSDRIGETKTAILLTVGTTLFIFVPIGLVIWLIIEQLTKVNWDPQILIEPVSRIYESINAKIDLNKDIMKYVSSFAVKLTSVGQSVFNSISGFIIDIFVAIVLLFFLINSRRSIEKNIKEILPFNRKNTSDIISKINLMVRSNAIGIPMLAMIQGFISWIGYMLFNVPNPVVFALITSIASVIPVVGTAIVWAPMSIYLFVVGQWQFALGLIAYGVIVISQSDNLIRFILQKKMADTHPLITLFGVLAGIPIFGFMGLIFGPLLVSLFLLFIEIFKKEYLYNQTEMVVFDLDGTLVDSIQDIANAANHGLEVYGYPTHSVEEIQTFVGNGITKLMERALPEEERSEENVMKVRAAFTEYYGQHNTDYTHPYPGIKTMLGKLNSSGIKIAVASNKYNEATNAIVKKCFPEIKFASVYGQIDGIPHKPAPDMVMKICKENATDPKNIFYVGDSDVDMQTGINAGVKTIGVTWGFRTIDVLNRYNPDHIVHSAEEITKIVMD